MLTLFSSHGRFDLSVKCTGDTDVDYHHTVEDIGIALGSAFKEALKDKKGICELCGTRGQTEKHHIKSKGSGGDDTKENLIEVCRKCHTKIHTGEIKLK